MNLYLECEGFKDWKNDMKPQMSLETNFKRTLREAPVRPQNYK